MNGLKNNIPMLKTFQQRRLFFLWKYCQLMKIISCSMTIGWLDLNVFIALAKLKSKNK